MSDLCKQRKPTQQGSLASGEGRRESNRFTLGVGGGRSGQGPALFRACKDGVNPEETCV